MSPTRRFTGLVQEMKTLTSQKQKSVARGVARCVVGGCVVAGLAGWGGAAGAQERTTIVVGKMVMPDGTLRERMGVVISGGKIEKVAPASELPAGSAGSGTYIRLDSAVLSPGLIDVGSSLGATGNTTEAVKPIDPSIRVIDAVDGRDPRLARALRAGITSVMVTPGENNVVCGLAATVRTYSADGRVDGLRVDGPMVFSLGPAVWNADREPTSRPGSLSMLRGALKAAKEGNGDAALTEVVGGVGVKAGEKKPGGTPGPLGKTAAVVKCAQMEDVDGAVRTFGEFGVVPVIQHDADGVQLAQDVAGEGAMAIVGPLTFGSSNRVLSAAGGYAKEGVAVAFAGGTPVIEGAGLRATAALAVRYGLDAAKGRQGMTLSAAKVAGVETKVGSIEVGKDADLVIFSGDPLRLDSRVIEVYVKGERVYSSPTGAAVEGAGDGR